MTSVSANDSMALMYQTMATMNQQREEQLKKYMIQQQEARKVEYTETLAQLEKQETLEKQQIVEATQKTEKSVVTEDGKDDGSISLWSKIKNAGKGVVNTVKGMFCDENGFSLKRTLTTVAVAAAGTALCVVTGGAATPFLIGAGVAMGGVQIAGGAIKAATAKTDAQAEAAWQDIGGGTFAVGASFVGAKGALRAAGKPVPKGNWFNSSLKATGECLKMTGKGAKEIAMHPIKSFTATKNYFKKGGVGRENWENAFKSDNAKANTKAKLDKRYDRAIQKLETRKQKLIEEVSKLDAVKDAKAIAKKNAEIQNIDKEIISNHKYKSEISENVPPEVDKGRVKELTDEIAALIKERNKIDSTKNLKEWNAVQKKIEQKIDVREFELNKKNIKGARSNEINGHKDTIKQLKEDLKAAADERPTTDTGKASRKAKIEEIENNIKRNEQQIKEVEKFQAIEANERAIEAANKKIEINKNTAKKHQDTIDELKVKNEELAKTHTDADNATILENQKVINQHQTVIDRVNAANSRQAKLISKAKKGLHKQNTTNMFETDGIKYAPYVGISAAATNGYLYGNDVTQIIQDVTTKDPKQAEMFKKLEEAQKERRLTLEKAYKSQASASPFGMNAAMMGMNNPMMTMGMNPAMIGMNNPAMSSLSLYQSPFPQIV